jgi:TP901 family phage tail tape measure protein
MDAAEFEKASVKASKQAAAWSKSLADTGRQAQALGRSLTASLTLPLAALGGGAIKAAMDFESSFAGIRKTVGDATDSMGNLTATGEMLRQGMRDLAKQLPVNVNELNRIGESAGQLGIKSQNILGFTEVMAKLGVTTNLTSDQAATALARLANITQMPQDQFDRLGSTVVQLGNNFATTESEIVEFGLRIAGAGKQAGISEPQILAIGTALSSVGVQAEAGGTAVQKVILQMLQATVTGGKGLETFAATAGMTGAEFKRAFEADAGGAFTAFVNGLGRQGKNAIAVLNDLGLADERLIRSFLALSGAGDLLNRTMAEGEKGWRENTALSKEAEQRFRTTANQVQLLWNKVTDLGIALGEVLLPHVIALVDKLSELVPYLETAVRWFSGLPEPVKNTALAVAGLLAALGPVLWAVGKIAELGSLVVGAFTAKGLAAKLFGDSAALAAGSATSLFHSVMRVAGAAAFLVTLKAWIERLAEVHLGVRTLRTELDELEMQDAGALDKWAAASRRLNDGMLGASVAAEAMLHWLGATSRAAKKAVDDIHLVRQASGDTHLPTPFDPKPTPPTPNDPPLTFATDDDEKAAKARLKASEDLADHQRRQRAEQRKAEEAEALDALRRAEQGYEALRTIQRRAADAQAEQTLSSLAYQWYSVNQWLAAEKEKYAGSARESEIFAALEREAAQRRTAAIVADQESRLKLTREQTLKNAKAIYEMSRDADELREQRTVSSTTFQINQINRWAEDAKRAFVGTEDQTRRFYDAVDRVTREKLAAVKQTWSGFFGTELPQIIMGAIQGGGDVGRALGGAFGTKLSTFLTDKLKDTMAKAAETGGGFFASGVGKMVGQGLGMALPVVGPLIGAFGGKLVGMLGNALGLGSAGRDLVKAYAEKMGGFDALRGKLAALGDQGEQLWKQLTQGVGRNNADEARRAIANVEQGLRHYEQQQARVLELQQQLQDEFGELTGALDQFGGRAPVALRGMIDELLTLNGLTEEQRQLLSGMLEDPSWQSAEEAAGRLGVALSALGPAYAQGKLSDQTLQTVRDLQLLEQGGADMNAVLRDSAKHIQGLVDTAFETGSKLPETLRPYIQRLIDMELLTDPKGELVTNIDQLSFADIEDEALSAIKGILEQIRDLLAIQIPAAASTAKSALNGVDAPSGSGSATPEHGNPQYDADGNPNPPGFSGGGVVNAGGGANARLHGYEAILPLPAGFSMAGLQYTLESVNDMFGGLSSGSLSGGRPVQITVVSQLDGREVARNQMQYFADELWHAGVMA